MTARRRRKATGTGDRHLSRAWLRAIEISPLFAALLLAAVWFGVPAELRDAMTRGGTWRTSATGLVFVGAVQPTGGLSEAPASVPADSDRRETAHGYYSALRTLRWETESPDTGFRVVARKVANSLAQRTGDFYRLDGSPKPVALGEDDPVYAPLKRWADLWSAETYVFLLPDPPEPSVVASAALRPEWLATPEELASLHATDTPDYLWKLKHRGEHPTFLKLAGGREEAFVRGKPRALSSRMDEAKGEFWLSIWMLPAAVWLEELEGGYWSDTPMPDPPPASLASTMSPTTAEYQSMLERLAVAYDANAWVLGPLTLRAVPQIVPKGVTAVQAAKYGEAVLRTSAAPGGGEVLNYRLRRISQSESAYASGARYQVLAQVTGTSKSVSESDAPQTILFVATWAQDPYPPLRLGRLAAAWDELRAWFAAGQRVSLIVCFVLLGATLVASPVAFVADRRAAERERLAAEMARVQRDAHDRVYNRMAALSMRLEAESSATSDSESSAAFAAVAAELADTRRDLREILGDARASSAGGIASAADPGALVADQLATLAGAQASLTGADIEFKADTHLPPITPEAGWDLQCITEEAVANAIRHGRATAVSVFLAEEAGGVKLEIGDNGTPAAPIDLDSLPTGSTGLRGIRARAERLGGSLDVRSDEGGTTLVVRIPVESSGRGRSRRAR